MKHLLGLAQNIRRYAKQLEALGLIILLCAAYYQFLADSYRREQTENLLRTAIFEVEHNLQRTVELVECSRANDCSAFHFDPNRYDFGDFVDTLSEDKEAAWIKMRKVLFLVGALLIAIAKFADWPRSSKEIS